MKSIKSKSLVVLMCVFATTAFQCAKNTVGENYNAHHSECLSHKNADSKGWDRPDSASFQYADGTLHVTHHNLFVNCGTAMMEGVINVTVTREGSVINIYEIEDEDNIQANCMCEVDNEFVINNIEPGTYTFIFHSWYPEPHSITYTF